jgi:hypothetical protein
VAWRLLSRGPHWWLQKPVAAVSSYGPPHDMRDVAARVKRLGGVIDYIALDKPLYYGHVFTTCPLLSSDSRAASIP